MNILAIIGSPRKGKVTDTLVDKAIEGIKSGEPSSKVKKIHLVDYNIQFCKNCLECRKIETDKAYVKCVIRDDMDMISEEIVKSDALIFGTPIHSAFVTAIMSTFLERVTWTFAKPERRYGPISGCPLPRSKKKRTAIIIVVSGGIPPLFRRFCDKATGHIKGVIRDSFNAKTVGDMYAGNTEGRGVEYYSDKAYKLGKKLI